MKTVYINEKRKLSKRKIKKIAKKIDKTNRKEEVVVAVSHELSYNKELIEEITSYNVKVLDGKWLFKFLLFDILKKVSSAMNKSIETTNIAILINNMEEVAFSQIIEIAKKVKTLKIVTTNINRFSYIEEKLYIQFGIAVQITSNKEKALANAEIIINYDFDDRINEFKLLPSATIINIKQKPRIDNSKFNGDVINSYEIECNDNLFEDFEEKNSYDMNILYESLIYRKDTFYNIKKQLDIDGVRIKALA